MKLLANENFPLTSVVLLKEAGYDIIAVGTHYGGILDQEVIELANREMRTILTFDRDYGELIFRKGLRPIAGVIYLRWTQFTPDEPAKYLINLFKTTEIQFERTLTVIAPDYIRQKRFN